MPVYAVTYAYPNQDGWKQHVMPHVVWLQDRLRDGSLLASGLFTARSIKAALLIMNACDRSTFEAPIATDPFAADGLIEGMTIREWDPASAPSTIAQACPGGCKAADRFNLEAARPIVGRSRASYRFPTSDVHSSRLLRPV